MTCRKTGCNHEFCWLCFGDWKEHNAHNCNRFIADDILEKQENAKIELNRYLHYFERYHNHLRSLALEHKLLEKIQERIEAMQKLKKSYTDQQTFLLAGNCLKECRHTLMFTYPFAFYLHPTNQSKTFEDNQSNLETAIEDLTGLLEKDLSDVNLIQKVQDKYRYCASRRKALLDHTKEGYKQDYWTGIDTFMTSYTLQQKHITPTKPERGVFPLDHEGECKETMLNYILCLAQNDNKYSKCQEESKIYFQCRMD
ncbi:unnamed protein product, partial [Didymodactylos carnosus]